MGFAVMAGVFVPVACRIPDARINPAVTPGFLISIGSDALNAADSQLLPTVIME
jgi:glycerol uptake facilitator-like aquaporin